MVGANIRGYSGPASPEDLTQWGMEHGHTFPNLSVDRDALEPIFGGPVGTPSEVLLAPGMQVVATGRVTSEQIEAVLPR